MNRPVYCNPFPAKPFYGSHRLDLVMIRPQGINNGAFVVSPDSVWYARVLLLFSACAMTDTGSNLPPSSSNVPSSPPWKPTMILTMVIMSIISIIFIILIIIVVTLVHYMTIMTNICDIAIMLVIACSVL